MSSSLHRFVALHGRLTTFSFYLFLFTVSMHALYMYHIGRHFCAFNACQLRFIFFSVWKKNWTQFELPWIHNHFFFHVIIGSDTENSRGVSVENPTTFTVWCKSGGVEIPERKERETCVRTYACNFHYFFLLTRIQHTNFNSCFAYNLQIQNYRQILGASLQKLLQFI